MKHWIIMMVLLTSGIAGHAQQTTIKAVKITSVDSLVKQAKQPVIINFWATYCIPCIEEIPYFEEMVQKYAADSVLLLLVSLDLKSYFPDKIEAFIKKQKITAPVAWLNETDADYFCPVVDRSWSGSLPATLLINNATGYRHFAEKELSREELEVLVQQLLHKK